MLNTIQKELQKTNHATLYGIKEAQTQIVCSLTKKKFLKKIGVFNANAELSFSIKDGKIHCFNKTINKDIPVEIINYTTDFNSRNHGIIDPSVLQNKTITIIGLGSGGSATALDLTRAGVVNFVLIDFDVVSISNLCRSVYDLQDIGKNKTSVIVEKILRINPCADIKAYNKNVLEMDYQLLCEILENSDLIIEASDNTKTKVLINGLAHHHTSVIYPSVYPEGKGGEIFFTKPGLPCYECVFSSILGKETKKGDWDYSTGQAKPMPALISDIQVVIARSVKLALGMLTDNTENSFLEKVTEPGCSLLFIGNESQYYVFNKPFQEIWAKTEINPECACQTLR